MAAELKDWEVLIKAADILDKYFVGHSPTAQTVRGVGDQLMMREFNRETTNENDR